jgi:hypothetical protein
MAMAYRGRSQPTLAVAKANGMAGVAIEEISQPVKILLLTNGGNVLMAQTSDNYRRRSGRVVKANGGCRLSASAAAASYDQWPRLS